MFKILAYLPVGAPKNYLASRKSTSLDVWPVLRIRIWDPGWVKNQDLDPG